MYKYKYLLVGDSNPFPFSTFFYFLNSLSIKFLLVSSIRIARLLCKKPILSNFKNLKVARFSRFFFFAMNEVKSVSWDNKTAPMIFCLECKNLLYPEGDTDRLMRWRCNFCKSLTMQGNEELVYSLNLKMRSDAVQENDLLAEFASDPTAQRDSQKKCPRCGMKDVTCFVNPLGRPQEDMTLFFACANTVCRHVWKGEEV